MKDLEKEKEVSSEFSDVRGQKELRVLSERLDQQVKSFYRRRPVDAEESAVKRAVIVILGIIRDEIRAAMEATKPMNDNSVRGGNAAGADQVSKESFASVKATGQKGLSVILDEIEADAERLLKWRNKRTVLALVEALRRSVEQTKWVAARDPNLAAHYENEITAILTESDKELGE